MSRMQRIKGFTNGVIMGSLISSLMIGVLLYILNMTEVIIFSIPYLPSVQQMLVWVYDNLQLSLVAFTLVFVLYVYHLNQLKRQLGNPQTDSADIMHSESLVDIWIGLFFGIGVIWTAIGMRSALLSALGGLDAATAAEEGAFAILQKLVDGGILLSLSTTIFGGIGGYLMRIYKSIKVGSDMQQFYLYLHNNDQQELQDSLHSIEEQLIKLNGAFNQPRSISHQSATIGAE